MSEIRIHNKKERQDLNPQVLGQAQQEELLKKQEEWQSIDERMFFADGKYRKNYIGKNVFRWFTTLFVLTYLIQHYLTGTFGYSRLTSDLSGVVIDVFLFWEYYFWLIGIYGKISIDALKEYWMIYLGLPLLTLVPFVIANMRWKHLNNIREISELRFETNLTNYKITKIDLKNRKIGFELVDGCNHDVNQLDFAKDILKDKLGYHQATIHIKKGKLSSKIKGYIVFEEEFPTVQEGIKPTSTESENALFLGIGDRNGTPVFTQKSKGFGLFQRHAIVVGTAGSGKSFFITQTLLPNYFISQDRYNHISKIKIIDFKESGDFEDIKAYDKVELCGGDPEQVIKLLRDVQIEIKAREAYKKKHGKVNPKTGKFEALTTEDIPKMIVMIDEVQTIMEQVSSKNTKLMTNTWNNINQLVNAIAAKGRSANVSLVVALQKATSSSLDTTVKANLAHSFVMKNDNFEFFKLDNQRMEENGWTKSLKMGQFYYVDGTNGDAVHPTLSVPLDYKRPNQIHIQSETQDFIDEIEQMKKDAVKEIIETEARYKKMEEEGVVDLGSLDDNWNTGEEMDKTTTPDDTPSQKPQEVEPELKTETVSSYSVDDDSLVQVEHSEIEIKEEDMTIGKANKMLKGTSYKFIGGRLKNIDNGKSVRLDSNDSIDYVKGEFIELDDLTSELLVKLGVQ